MKHIIIVAIICLTYHFTAQGQNVPQGIAYQAAPVKDGSYSVAGQNPGAIYWANKDIKVRFTIFEKYPNGSSQYTELHEVTTDDYGVFNVIIGQGMAMSGDFENIPWELGTAHLQVEIDFENTNTFTLTSLERFWSVPYAFATNQTEGSNVDSALSDLNNKYDYLRNRDKDTVIGNEGISYQTLDSINKALQVQIAAIRSSDKDTIIGNELQMLSLKEDSLTISDGNTVIIKHPENFDNDSTNEIQTISLANDTISLSNGGGKVALSRIKSYLNENGGSSKSNVTANSICYEGILVDISQWAKPLGIINITPFGEIFDSAFIFSSHNTSKTYLHELKQDTIFEISNSYSSYTYVGDSIAYIAGSLIKINSDLSVSILATFAGPAYGYNTTPIINKSRDLIWIEKGPSPGTGGDIKKFNYTLKKLQTFTNPRKGSTNSSEVAFWVSGDSILLDNRLINSNTMTTISTFVSLDKVYRQYAQYFNGQLYYYNQSKREFRVINLFSQADLKLGNVYGMNFHGINNDQVLFSTGAYSGTTKGWYTLCNLTLLTNVASFCSISKTGLFTYRGLGTAPNHTYPLDNSKKVMGGIYIQNNILYSVCVNGLYPRYTTGYFYTR